MKSTWCWLVDIPLFAVFFLGWIIGFLFSVARTGFYDAFDDVAKWYSKSYNKTTWTEQK